MSRSPLSVPNFSTFRCCGTNCRREIFVHSDREEQFCSNLCKIGVHPDECSEVITKLRNTNDNLKHRNAVLTAANALLEAEITKLRTLLAANNIPIPTKINPEGEGRTQPENENGSK